MSYESAKLPEMRPILMVRGERLSPGKVTELLGVRPTRTYEVGDVGILGHPACEGKWILYGERKEFGSVGECIDDFVSQFPDGVGALQRLSGCTCSIEVEIDYWEVYPVVDLEVRQVLMLAAIRGDFCATLVDMSRSVEPT